MITSMRDTDKTDAPRDPEPTIGKAKPPCSPLQGDSLYKAKALGRSKDGRSASDHDDVIYGTDRK